MRRNVPRWAAVAAVAWLECWWSLDACLKWHIGSALLYNISVLSTKPYRSGFSDAISNATLAAEVANLNIFYNKYKHKTQINYTPADMPRMVLSWMLRFATENQLAGARIRGSRSRRQEAQARWPGEVECAPGVGDTLPEAAVLNGLPPDMLPQLGTWIQIQVAIDGRRSITETRRPARPARRRWRPRPRTCCAWPLRACASR